MRRIFGDRKRIDLSSSEFRKFIETGSLYVDKTRFIEHIYDEPSDVLLFTRPRRTGKSLNLDMLRAFFDCRQDTRALFGGLYIEGSNVFEQLNKYPIIYLNLKELGREDYKERLFDAIESAAYAYLSEQQIGRPLMRYLGERDVGNSSALRRLIEDIHAAYGMKPYVLIDEYDKVLTDNVGTPEYEEIRIWLSKVFESALKDNNDLGKAVITGITRVSQESMFSGLNNIEVYDVFRPGVFDGDFSLTEDEALELMNEEQLDVARIWYNNYRVGDKKLYTIYSVMSYLKSDRLENYWGQSGMMDLLGRFLDARRMEKLVDLFSDDAKYETALERRLSFQGLLTAATDKMYYSLAVQAGYLSYDVASRMGTEDSYEVFLHNEEIRSVWKNLILDEKLLDPNSALRNIFDLIANVEEFSRRLEDYINYRLSIFDLRADLEWVYHVLTLGLMLGAGLKCSSNKEAGFGRYDLLVEGRGFSAILEFKRAKTARSLKKEAGAALAQIDEKQYVAASTCDSSDSSSGNGGASSNASSSVAVGDAAVPIYKVGIACYKTACHVETMKHGS